MQRSLLMLTISSSSSVLRLYPFIAKKLSELSLLYSINSTNYSVVPRRLYGASRSASILGFLARPGNEFSTFDCEAFAKRHFCKGSRVIVYNGSMVSYKKSWKKIKPLAVSGERGIANSSTSSFYKVDDATSSEKVEGNVKQESFVSTSITNSKPNSKPKGRMKKQSKGGKTSQQLSDTITSDVEADTKSSRSKMATTGKSGQSLAKERKSIGKTLKPLYPSTGKTVIVVESVTKANVIQGYLGDMYEVLPSYGHVRDLAARSGSVRPNDDFSMVWEVPSAAWTYLKSIKVALSRSENLILALDPDREGEAIAWHIVEMLRQQDALRQDVTIARVVFHEITETSIKSSLQAPREIDVNLVHAYLARRALDYLIGFNISPLLWRKLPGCQSAGRVQSAALSLICDKELEIDEFKPQEYWTIVARLNKKDRDQVMNAHLTHIDSNNLNQLSINSYTVAKAIEQKINAASFEVVATKKTKIQKNPPTPYITSTLQQDAAKQLHFSPTHTMELAQQLYEGVQLSNGQVTGLITYHRTDGLHISVEAVKDIRSMVIERYGSEFLSGSAHKYFKKLKNAQEAHEAIRPTNICTLPSTLTEALDEDALKLYTLIWSQTLACQMEPAMIEQVQVDVGDAGKLILFRSTSSKIDFLGYQAAYEDTEVGATRTKDNDSYYPQKLFEFLNLLKPGDPLLLSGVELMQHFTQPSSRYSEGSLVKKLEELGIGRPSTYASALKVLQDRNFVIVKDDVLYPEVRGRMVSAFLSHHFTEVTDYSFTADMESELDNVSVGLTEWKGLLRDYWDRFYSHCKRAESIHIHQVEKMLEKTFSNFLFGSLPDNSRTCPRCMEGTLIFKVSSFGVGYCIGCDQHPKCKYIAKSLYGDEEEDEIPEDKKPMEKPKLLGLHPASSEKILLKAGPYGFYVQLGEDKKGFTPKRASVSHIKDMDTITLENALELLRYPVTLGNHPKDGQPVIIRLARAGFSIRHGRSIASVPKNLKPDHITMEKALKLLSSKRARLCGRPKREMKVEDVEAAM